MDGLWFFTICCFVFPDCKLYQKHIKISCSNHCPTLFHTIMQYLDRIYYLRWKFFQSQFSHQIFSNQGKRCKTSAEMLMQIQTWCSNLTLKVEGRYEIVKNTIFTNYKPKTGCGNITFKLRGQALIERSHEGKSNLFIPKMKKKSFFSFDSSNFL